MRAVLQAQQLVDMQAQVENVYVHDSIYAYITNLMNKTRNSNYIELGVSPRGTIACVRMAKAWAFLQGREYVIPSDVTDIFMDIAKHRIVQTQGAGGTCDGRGDFIPDYSGYKTAGIIYGKGGLA